MKRRTFVRSSALALAAVAALPYGRASALAESAPPRYRPRTGRLNDVQAVTGDGRQVTLRATDLADLRSRLYGRMLLAEDNGYDDARRILNPSFDKHPALIVQARGAADVRAAVDFARENGGLLVAVKCGGHSLSGKSTCDRGMMIDLSTFRDVRVDPQRRRARVTGGSLLGQVDHEAMAVGLTTPLGTVSHTGVGGLVTGGGFGRLGRRFGLSIDNVESMDVVTADGVLRRASADENADLFWGVRGGGGNFGVVTSFEFRLHPMQRQVLAGNLLYPFPRAREVLSVFADYAPRAQDDLQLDMLVVQPPGDAPGLVGFHICYSGPESGAATALAPVHALGTPVVNTLAPTDYVALQKSGDISDPRAIASYTKSGMITEMSTGLIQAVAEGFGGHPAVMLFQQGGGAIGRVPHDATAFVQRDTLANMLCMCDWEFGEDPAPHMDWVRNFWTGVEPFTQGFYVNDLESEHTTDDVRANYRQNHARLVSVKNRYDPDNLFRLNANILPSV